MSSTVACILLLHGCAQVLPPSRPHSKGTKKKKGCKDFRTCRSRPAQTPDMHANKVNKNYPKVTGSVNRGKRRATKKRFALSQMLQATRTIMSGTNPRLSRKASGTLPSSLCRSSFASSRPLGCHCHHHHHGLRMLHV
jgi:hypothetical protein